MASTIRPFEAQDAPAAARLYLRSMRGIPDAPSAWLADYFVEVFLDNPWRAPGIESLVAVDGDQMLGFLGLIPRPMRFENQSIQAAVVTQLMVDRERGKGNTVFELIRRGFAGPQDLLYTDGAAEVTARIWEPIGGDAARLYSFSWLRILRPFSTLQHQSIGRRTHGVWNSLNALYRLGALPMDLLAQRIAASALRPTAPFAVVPADADTLCTAIGQIGWREKLQPAYDPAAFGWLMKESAKARLGELRLRITQDAAGKPNGWFVYYLQRNGVCSLQQLGARRAEEYRGVLRSMFADAAAAGGSCVKGQSQPRRLVDLTEEHCLFRHPNSSVLFHTRNPAIRLALHRGDAALSRLDGESWLRFATEDWLRS
jgi:hypothetical protein